MRKTAPPLSAHARLQVEAALTAAGIRYKQALPILTALAHEPVTYDQMEGYRDGEEATKAARLGGASTGRCASKALEALKRARLVEDQADPEMNCQWYRVLSLTFEGARLTGAGPSKVVYSAW